MLCNWIGLNEYRISQLVRIGSDIRVQFPSSYWLINFSNFYGTLFKSGSQPLAAFQKSSVKIQEIYQPTVRKRLKFKIE